MVDDYKTTKIQPNKKMKENERKRKELETEKVYSQLKAHDKFLRKMQRQTILHVLCDNKKLVSK